MPMNISLERLDDGNGFESTLKSHKAKWHKKCRLRFNKKAFNKQSRRELAAEQEQQSEFIVHTQSVHRHLKSPEPTCFFCDKPAGSSGLHEASTFNIDKNV